jgi:hypothetical protein
MNGNPVNHTDDLNAWLYGVRRGTIPKTRYSVLPDDAEIADFSAQRHLACISQGGFQGGAAQGVFQALAANNNQTDVIYQVSFLQQLTYGLSAQTEVLAESNNIQNKLIQHQKI